MATVDFLLVTDVRLKDWLSKDREYVRSFIDCDLAEWSKRIQQKFSEIHFVNVVLQHLEKYSGILYSQA